MAEGPQNPTNRSPRAIVGKVLPQSSKALLRKHFGDYIDKPVDVEKALKAAESGPRGAAQADRIRTVLAEFGKPTTDTDDLSELRDVAVAALSEQSKSRELLWLLYLAFVARNPTNAKLDLFADELRWAQTQAVVEQLRVEAALASPTWATTAPLELATVPVVDATMTASREVHNGIQRVVREFLPRWNSAHELSLAVFDEEAGVWRAPSDREEGRLIHWHELHSGSTQTVASGPATDAQPTAILVPWRTTFVVPELAGQPARKESIKALALWTPTDVTSVVHDLMPMTVPDSYLKGMPNFFAGFVTVLRECARVATTSYAVARDVEGLRVSFINQGIAGPMIETVSLPLDSTEVSPETVSRIGRQIRRNEDVPLVLSVASNAARKNAERIMWAAESLWREGLEFELLFIAGFGKEDHERFDLELARLRDAGRPVSVVTQVDDATIWSAYQLARFTVFISMREGYGLPAAESISVGTPVVLSKLGSMIEIGEPGGAEFVDPTDLDQITDAMRRLLTDEARLKELTMQAEARELTNWDQYSAQLWSWLINAEVAP